MKGVVEVDPAVYECGPATESVRAILRAHGAVDWFVPPSVSEESARRSFARYHELADDHAPDLFGPQPLVELATGDWSDFRGLCDQARDVETRWDWKFGALKRLTKRHSEGCGWVKPMGPPVTETRPTPSAVFLRIGEGIVWNVRLARVDLSAFRDDRREPARFFKEWADLDTFEAVEWQLAEPVCPLEDNPFTHLLRLYEGGHYPFHLAKDRVVLFHFSPSGRATTF